MADKLLEQRFGHIYITTTILHEDLPIHEDAATKDAISMATAFHSTLSPGFESNPDSCYDSDASSVASQRNSAQLLDMDEHSAITRRTSDTLASEHTETDNSNPEIMSTDLSCHIPAKPQSLPVNEPLDGIKLMDNTEYAAKVEFGLRLGYDEEQVLSALNKVGYRVSEDELLNELIQLGELSEDVPDEEELTTETLRARLVKTALTEEDDDKEELRPIVIDGSNVAMGHGNKDVFSCMGIKLAVDWFHERGHNEITAFVPIWRKETSRPDTPITNQDILLKLEKENVVVFTPARRVGGKRVICYDDRYILRLAVENGGIVVSNDNYRDLIDENANYKKVVEKRLLMFSFVNDRFMPPDDPLGRYGPSLADFLQTAPRGPKNLPPICPYGKKCTFGNKCKYYHPERGQQPVKLVTEKLVEKARKTIKEVKEKGHLGSGEKKLKGSSDQPVKKTGLTRSRSIPTAPKQTLARTQSLHPGYSFVSSAAPITLAQFMNKPPDEDTSVDKEVTSKISVSITPDPESEDYLKYNDKLSQLRRKVEEADERDRMALSEGDLASHENNEEDENSSTNNKITNNKRIAGHWSLMHDNLRPVNSDPHIPGHFSGGHLALAKKLSDEGKTGKERVRPVGHAPSPNKLSPTSIISSRNVNQPVVPSADPKVRNHKTLQRQLSLKGSDDPRLCQGLTRFNTMPVIQMEPAVLPQSTQSSWATQSHIALGKHVSCPISGTSVGNNLDDSPRRNDPGGSILGGTPERFYHANSKSPDPGNKVKTSIPSHLDTDRHFPIHRLRSDPMVRPGEVHGYMMPVKYPKMTRQNSTSDPQLNVYHYELLRQNLEQNSPHIPQHMKTAPNSPHMPLSPHFGSQHHMPFTVKTPAAGLQHEPSHSSNVFISTCSSHTAPPNVYNTSMHGVQGHVTSQYQARGPVHQAVHAGSRFFLSSQAESPAQIPVTGQDMSVPPPFLSHHNQDLSKPPPPLIQPTEHLGIHPAYPPAMPPPNMQPSQLRGSSPQHNMPAMNIQRLAHNLELSAQHNSPSTESAWMSSSKSTNQDDAPMSDCSHPPISQTDSRYNLYYHMCGLFKEADVRRVMVEHPDETNPQTLCRYLI